MSQLHLIQSPILFQEFEQRFKFCVAQEDSILFLNDSLFSLTTKDFNSEYFHECIINNSIWCIEEQLNARAIADSISNKIALTDYSNFVNMSQQADKIVSW